MKINFKDIPNQVNQEFQLPEEGRYALVITKAEFKLSSSGGTNINIETTLKGTNIRFTTFNPLKDAQGNQHAFGLARLKRVLVALDKVPEVEIDLSTDTGQKLMVSFILGGEFNADLKHRTYKGNDGVDRTTFEIADWDNISGDKTTTTPQTDVVEEVPQVNQTVATMVEDDDII